MSPLAPIQTSGIRPIHDRPGMLPSSQHRPKFAANQPVRLEPSLQPIQIGTMKKSPLNLLLLGLTWPLALPLIGFANTMMEPQLIKQAQQKVPKFSVYPPWPRNFNILAATLQDTPGLSSRGSTFNYTQRLIKKLETSGSLFDAHYELEQTGVKRYWKILEDLFGWFQVPVSSTNPIRTWEKQEKRDRYVVFITGKDFGTGKKIQTKTVAMVQGALQKHYNIPDSNFKRLDESSLDEVKSNLSDLSQHLGPQDELLVYLLGHGEILDSEGTSVLQGGKEGGFVLNAKEVLSKSAMKELLEEQLQFACHSGSLIADICHAGAWVA